MLSAVEIVNEHNFLIEITFYSSFTQPQHIFHNNCAIWLEQKLFLAIAKNNTHNNLG